VPLDKGFAGKTEFEVSRRFRETLFNQHSIKPQCKRFFFPEKPQSRANMQDTIKMYQPDTIRK
jgi:hypothetical protein